MAWIHYGRYLHERMQGKPTQYITKRQEFYGREFRVTPRRPDPPARDGARRGSGSPMRRARTVLDVGTGSGALAVTPATGDRRRSHWPPTSPRAAAMVAADNARAPGGRR